MLPRYYYFIYIYLSEMYNLSYDNIVITCDNMVHKGGAKLDEGIAFRASGATEGRVVRRFGTGRTRAAYIPCLRVYVHIHLSICVSAGALWELAVHCGPPVGGLCVHRCTRHDRRPGHPRDPMAAGIAAEYSRKGWRDKERREREREREMGERHNSYGQRK